MDSAEDKDVLEAGCWGAACTALATVAPRWGVTPGEVRSMCEQAALEAGHDIEAMQMMVVYLIQNIAGRGADPESLVHVAQDAYKTHQSLDGQVTLSDLFKA